MHIEINVFLYRSKDKAGERSVMMAHIPTTSRLRRKFDRIAPFYGRFQGMLEPKLFGRLRSRLFRSIRGERALEVGIGAGINMPYYPPSVEVTGIDLSPKMLDQARKRASALNLNVDLMEMDVQELDFSDSSFDTVFATFAFCGVPNPIQGLNEMRRVCRAGGRIVLLEHVRPDGRLMGKVFDALDTLVVRVAGSHVNRKTVDNIRSAGWKIEIEEAYYSSVIRWVEAVK
jgi:phosphatidylethanolamine/phosphatidyl-N-methylethanolamine N-methyltransferase